MKKLLILLLLIPMQLLAADYYVKVGGGGAGTIGSPFSTISQLNAQALSPGDHVYFNRGDTWIVTSASNYLSIENYSGNVTDSIFYGAYGTGAKPIITNKTSLTGWNTEGNWSNVSGNIWLFASAGLINNVYGWYQDRGRLWLDGTEVQKVQSNTSYTPNASFPWTHNAQQLYVYATSNPATFYSNIEVVGLLGYTCIINKDYIVVENLDLRGATSSLFFQNADHCSVRNCIIGEGTGLNGIMIYTSNNCNIHNNTFDTGDHLVDTYIFRNTEDAVYMQSCTDLDVYRNTFIDWGHTAINYAQTGAVAMTNIKVYSNICTTPDIDYGRFFVYNITSGGDGICTGNEIYNNYIYNTRTCNQISGSGLKFYNNIIDGVFGTAYRGRIGYGLVLSTYAGGVCSDNEIYNNIIMNCADWGIEYTYGTVASSNNLIKNNILYNNDNVDGFQLQLVNAPAILQQTFQNNLFYKSGITDVVNSGKMNYGYTDFTVTEWNTYNGSTTNMRAGNSADIISGNIGGDPLFTDPTNANYLLRDYHLSVGSPAIGAGIGVGLNTDYAGNAWAATPSIGALEYNSSPPTPTDLAVVETSLGTPKSVTATMSGNVTATGGGTITTRGVCYSTSANPTISNSKTATTGTTGSYTVTLTGLLNSTTYHARAYVTNESGTSYGADMTFETPVFTYLKATKVIINPATGKALVIQ